MNFNLDDPLGDLLSDNDNDSFFDIQPGKRKNINKPIGKSTEGKGKMEDLFGIKEENEQRSKVPLIKTSLDGGRREEKPLTKNTSIAKTKTEESDDILSDLGFDPKNPKINVSTKSNLFDDILGSIESKKPNTAPNQKTEELNVRKHDTLSTRGTISRQSTDTTDNSGTTGQLFRPKTSSGRRSSTASPSKNIPFDLFSSTNEKPKETARPPTPKIRPRGSAADWLGLGVDSEDEQQKTENVELSDTPAKIEVLRIEDKPDNEMVSVVNPLTVHQTPTSIPLAMTTSNLENQKVAQIINQQEYQLSLATQMKTQEVALLEMQKKQHELLSRQEAQFNDLLQKQISRQHQLEQNIKSQQERINAHIQLLLAQPIDVHYLNQENSSETRREKQPMELVELEADVKRLELEKLRLEEMVSNINANYEKEIEIMDKSFRKQIEVLENHLESVETRLKKEIENLHSFYAEKLSSANEDKQNIKANLEADLNAIKDTHQEEIQRLKKSYEENLDSIRDDYRRMLENIRESKLLEFAAVQENGSYLETLRMASNNLETVSGDLQTLRGEIERKVDIIHRERELKLEAREKKLEDSERRMKIVEEAAEEEKRNLMNLVTALESQLSKLSKESSEENWILRQKMASLEAEKSIFEREKLLFREQMAKDEKRIEELKENQLAETQRQMESIQEERTQLNIEKAKYETAKKLDSNSDLERSRLEMEASIKVAQDAAHQVEIERVRFLKLQRELESQKRALMNKEHLIRNKEEQLEQDISEAKAAERRAQQAIQKARSSEHNFNEKIQFIQLKIREISLKESNLSKERLNLSQERLELQNLRTKLEQNKCSLCRIGEQNWELSNLIRNSDETNGIPVIDDHQYTLTTSNDIDRFLDENILKSLQRMKDNSWNEMLRPNEENNTNLDDLEYNPSADFSENL